MSSSSFRVELSTTNDSVAPIAESVSFFSNLDSDTTFPTLILRDSAVGWASSVAGSAVVF
jgi:hypothetical protein